MTPSQEARLATDQSIERIEKLSQWLARSRSIVGECGPGLKKTLAISRVRYQALKNSVEDPPTVALVGTSPALRAQMVGALTSPQDADDSTGQKDDPNEILRRLLVRDGKQHTVTAVRFAAAETQSPLREYPFRVGLLGIADLAAIMVHVHQACFPGGIPPKAMLNRMRELQKDVATKVQPATQAGLDGAHVIALAAKLNRLYPNASGLRLLAASNYWNDLAEVAAHISDAERVEALALLWGGEPELTLLFRLMVATLANFHHAREIFVPRDAMFELDQKSGWFTLHQRSIIAATTLQEAADESSAEVETIKVVGRYGHTAAPTRSMLAAIAAEVALNAPQGASTATAGADLLDLPAAPMPCDLNIVFARTTGRKRRGIRPDLKQLLSVFAHMKASYLVDRSIHEHCVTALVPCIAKDQPALEALPAAINDWVELSQGREPHQRERQPARLFLIAEEADEAPAGGNNSNSIGSRPSVASFDDLSRAHNAGDLLKSHAWLHEWSPGQPFANTFTLRVDRGAEATKKHPAKSAELATLIDAGSAIDPADRPQAPETSYSTTLPAAATTASGSTGGRDSTGPKMVLPRTQINSQKNAQRLLDEVASAGHPSSKARELRYRLSGLHRHLQNRFHRYLAAGANTALNDWRHDTASVLTYRIGRLAQRQQLAPLLVGLRLDEAELIAIYRRSELAALDGRLPIPARAPVRPQQALDGEESASRPDIAAPPQPTVPRAMSVALAEDVLGYWLSAMRSLASSDRFCRQIDMPDWVLEHLVDELGAGAVRLGLVRRLAEAIESMVAQTRAGEAGFASVAGAVINRFLERLDLPPNSSRSSKRALAASVSGSGTIASSEPATHEETSGRMQESYADVWPARFTRLIEENMVAARKGATGDAGADLASLLSEFPENRFEVES